MLAMGWPCADRVLNVCWPYHPWRQGGVNATLFEWGDVLLRESGKRRLDPYADSFVLSHLGCVSPLPDPTSGYR